MSTKDHGRGSSGKNASGLTSQSKSPNNTSNGGDAAITTPTTANPAPARGGKRVKDDHDDNHDRHRDDKKKLSSAVSQASSKVLSSDLQGLIVMLLTLVVPLSRIPTAPVATTKSPSFPPLPRSFLPQSLFPVGQ